MFRVWECILAHPCYNYISKKTEYQIQAININIKNLERNHQRLSINKLESTLIHTGLVLFLRASGIQLLINMVGRVWTRRWRWRWRRFPHSTCNNLRPLLQPSLLHSQIITYTITNTEKTSNFNHIIKFVQFFSWQNCQNRYSFLILRDSRINRFFSWRM